MMRTTVRVRLLWLALAGDIFFLIILYLLFPLQRKVLTCPLPFLPEGHLYFWIAYIAQTTGTVQGPLGGFTFLALNFEVTLCLTALLKVLAEQIERVEGRTDLNHLIHLHQLMLEEFVTFRELVSHVFSSFLLVTSSTMVLSAYIILEVSFELLWVFLIPSLMGFVGVPCILAEMISVASAGVGHSAYGSPWIGKDRSIINDLTSIIRRSQRSCRLRAGMFGSLGVAKYQQVVKRYYQFLQALQNLS